MINISIHNADDKQAVLQAYSVALTEELNSYPTVNFMYDITGHNATVEDMLDQGTIFEINGQLYRHLNSNPVPVGNFRTYTVDAIHIGSMLQDNYVTPDLKGKHTIDEVAKAMVSGLDGFNFKIDDKFDPFDFGDDGIEAGHGEDILNTIVATWNCEYKFDNKTIHIAKSVGKKEDSPSFLFVDNDNVSKISWTEDYSNFKTAIHGFGKQIEIDVPTGASSEDVSTGPTEPVNGDWGPVIKYAAQLMDVSINDSDVNLVKAQIKLESGGNEQIVGGNDGLSDGNATGLLQFKPGTFNYYAVEGYKTIKKGFHQLLAAFNIPNFLGQISGRSGWSPHGAPRSKTIIKPPTPKSTWGWPFRGMNGAPTSWENGQQFGHTGWVRPGSGGSDFHDGFDFGSAHYSGDILCVHGGTVTSVGYQAGFMVVTVKSSDGLTTVYQEFGNSVSVRVGQAVKTGDVIGRLTTSHLHLGITTKDFATAFAHSFDEGGGWLDPIKTISSGGGGTSGATQSKPSRVNEFIQLANSYLGQPYFWGGEVKDGAHPTDCSGLWLSLALHFGIRLKNGARSTYQIVKQMRPISRSEVQTGDAGFKPDLSHVVVALDNKTLIQESSEKEPCNIKPIDGYYSPLNWYRYDPLANVLNGDGSSVDIQTEKVTVYSCQTDYVSPLAKKKNIGKRWASPASSDTITDENQLTEWLKTQLQDYPDVEYSVDWISFTKNAGGYHNDLSIGNYGWLRDRYGLDIKVRIKSFTKYLDDSDPQNVGSITFGNTSKALRDINAYLVDDLKTLKQSAREVNDWISNRMRISSSSREWINETLGKEKERRDEQSEQVKH